MRRQLRSLFGLLYFYSMAYILRSPLSVPLLVFRMSVFVILLTLVGGHEYAVYALSGALVALAFGAGLSQFSVDINALRVSGYRYILLTAPLGPATFAIGTALGMSLLSFVGLTVFFLPWYYICHPGLQGVLELGLVLALTWLIGLSIGFLLSILIRTPHVLFNVTDTVYALLVYLMPVYYPIELLPQSLRPLTLISPATHAGILVREIAVEGHIVSPLNMYVIIVVAAALLALISRISKWREA